MRSSDPSSVLLGSATASQPGKNAVLQEVPATTLGTYTITVSGGAGTVGNYTVAVSLNAAFEAESIGGPSNDTPATAQDLNPSFGNLSAGQASAQQSDARRQARRPRG